MEKGKMSKVGNSIASCGALGFGKKYESEFKDYLIELKTKSKMTLLGLKFLLDRSFFRILAYQLSAK